MLSKDLHLYLIHECHENWQDRRYPKNHNAETKYIPRNSILFHLITNHNFPSRNPNFTKN